MAPPPTILLQLFNALTAVGSMLALTVGITIWTAGRWDPLQIGIATTAANLCYGGLVAQGGLLAERWGRARAGILGSAIGAFGCLLALLIDHPAATVIAAMLGFAGPALFFPGSAGLFSDASGVAGKAPPPLHAKVSNYNLGWATGNCAAFMICGLVADQRTLAYGVSMTAFLLVLLGLWRWRNLPPSPPQADGDRAPHPALPRLTLMYRVNLFIACVLGFVVVSQLVKALVSSGMGNDEATRIYSIVLSCYAGSYIAMFLIVRTWTGWILKPWRLWLCQLGYPLGAGGLMFAWLVGPSLLLLAGCGVLFGLAYGAAYTGSIYYSLRLPHGASRAAGLHETFIGLGQTVGPLLAGGFLSLLMPGLGGLAVFVLAFAVMGLAWQVALIPGAVRLGAR